MMGSFTLCGLSVVTYLGRFCYSCSIFFYKIRVNLNAIWPFITCACGHIAILFLYHIRRFDMGSLTCFVGDSTVV